MTHIEILEAIAQVYKRPRYLEIGTGDGGCFYRVARHCSVAVTVDVPENPYGEVTQHSGEISAAGCKSVIYHGLGSDQFFEDWSIVGGEEFDLIFIDGSHWYDQVKRDLENALCLLSPLGTIAMHDTWSPSEHEAAQGSDEVYLLAQEVEADPTLQAYTLPVRPGLTLLRQNRPRFV